MKQVVAIAILIGPPPLEDMTEQLERVKHHRKKLCSTTHPHNGAGKKAMSCEQKKETVTKAAESGSGFGGLRKGFLSGSQSKSGKVKVQSSPSTPEVTVDDVIRPKQQQNTGSSGLEFPEVQEAMKESFPFLNTQS